MTTRLLLAAWCVVLFFAGLGAGDLYRNEGLRALLAAEGLRGSWLVPRLYGEPHLTKPPGMTCAIALCSLPAGAVTPLTARLPSALAGVVGEEPSDVLVLKGVRDLGRRGAATKDASGDGAAAGSPPTVRRECCCCDPATVNVLTRAACVIQTGPRSWRPSARRRVTRQHSRAWYAPESTCSD